MQNPRATTSLKPGGRDVNIAKYLSQMNIGHHCRKWKAPILGVERIVLRDVFFFYFFSVRGTKTFFSLSHGKILQCSPYHVDRRAKKAALFSVACDANPDTRVKIPNAMRIKGYSPSEAADRLLQMQVRRKVDKIKGEAIPGPPAPAAAALSALLTLSTTANVGRPALRTITTVPGCLRGGWD
jgi:hypothetical protein